MDRTRPQRVGAYEVLQDIESAAQSVRVIRMSGADSAVRAHVHHRSAQTYLVVRGRVAIEVDGVESIVEPYGAVAVPPGVAHLARPVGGPADVVNISVPPLAPDDQTPL